MKLNELETLIDLFKHVSSGKSKDGYLSFLKNGKWHSMSSGEFSNKVLSLAHGFIESGIKPKDRVAIFADSSPYWLVFDFALQIIGAISVPMFTNIAIENLDFQIKDSKVNFAFVDGGDKWQVLKSHKKKFNKIFTHNLRVAGDNIIKLSDIFEKYEQNAVAPKYAKVKPNDIATIIYTSGSTGNPKGVCLTHANLLAQLQDATKFFPLKEDDVALSFLPLAHIFERLVILLYLSSKIKIYFADKVENVPSLLKEVKPTIITVVPRFLEKIYAKINEKSQELSFFKRLISFCAIKYANSLSVGYANKLPIFSLFNKLIYKKFLHAFGGNIKIVVSGGAPLNPKIYKFFLNISLPLYQGYGLTEAAPVISSNCPRNNRFASSGKLFPQVKVKINDDGEILAKGRNIMHGYLNNDKATEKVIKDGWLYTGDLGHIDADGFLFVTGRRKEIQKTSNGKYVRTLTIENLSKEISYVDNVVVIADGRSFVSLIIFPDLEKLKQKKIKIKTFEQIVSDNLDHINKKLNHWEKIRKFHISREIASIKNGMLTPSMKLKRYAIEDFFKKEIDNMYK